MNQESRVHQGDRGRPEHRERPEHPEHPEHPEQTAQVSRRVIVADDSAVVRELIAVNLELEGLEVEQCGDGAEALRRIAARPPDLVMLDIVMPVMDGF